MPELKGDLERLAERVAPPDDAFDRLTRTRSRRQRNRRLGAALVALAVAGAGVGTALIALGRSGVEPLPALRISNGYGIQFPYSPLGYEKKGLAILEAATNLPNGTKVNVYLFSADIESPGEARVDDGRIRIRIWNGFCHDTELGLVGTTTRVTVTVSPDSGEIGHGGFSRGGTPRPPFTPPPYQPPGVLAVLGSHFEKLTGDQVVDADGKRMLIASKLVQLPAETCGRKLVYTGGGSFDQVPVDQPARLPKGPFPQPPFSSCPDPVGTLPVEAGEVEKADEVAVRFDVALTRHEESTLRQLADPSVQSLGEWRSSGLVHPFGGSNVPSGNYLPAVPSGCGAFIAFRTWGVTLTKSGDELDPLITYLLVLRKDGWRVWGQLPRDGR